MPSCVNGRSFLRGLPIRSYGRSLFDIVRLEDPGAVVSSMIRFECWILDETYRRRLLLLSGRIRSVIC